MNELWMTASYNTRTWPYVGIPATGDIIRYMNDGFDGTVIDVRRTRILMSDGTTYRRRLEARRILAWISTRISVVATRQNKSAATVPARPLRPLTPYVREVNLNL